MLSDYLKNSSTTLFFQFRVFSSAFVTTIKLSDIHAFSGDPSLDTQCTVNSFNPLDVSVVHLNFSTEASSWSMSLALSRSYYFDSLSVVRCSIGYLSTPKSAAGSRSVSISTLNLVNVVDFIHDIPFPPIFNHFASPIEKISTLRMSSVNDPHFIRSTLLSSFVLSFTSSGAGTVKSITLQGLSDFTTLSAVFSSAQTCVHGNIEYSVMTNYTSPFLSIFVVEPYFFSAEKANVVCTVLGLILPSSAVASKKNLVISTFSVDNAAVDTMSGISLPAIFASIAPSVSVSLSSLISNDTGVIMTLAFTSPIPPINTEFKGRIKLIMLYGVFFYDLSTTQPFNCDHQNGNAIGIASIDFSSIDPVVVMRFSGTDSIASGPYPITCVVSGFRNWESPRKSSLTVGLTTWDAFNKPLDTASPVAFPNIFAYSASNSIISLSSQIIKKSPVSMTIGFIVPVTNQPIKSITLSGLPALQQRSISAQCSVSPWQPLESDFVLLNSTVDAVDLKMSFAYGLPVTSGIAGIKTLEVTCSISSLINPPLAFGSSNLVSVHIFGADSFPLYFQSAIKFPAIFEQSLGINRPRVSFL
jgi:hypothetical protein